MSDLPKRLRIKASMIALGERIPWGSDTALMEEAADMIEALSASVENHQLHMLGIARERDQLRALLAAAPDQPAAQGKGDQQEDLHVWRAITRFGETCHFGEASTARAWAGENGTIERVELNPVPELRVVERQEQGEVQRLRVHVCKLGRYGAAFDPASTHYAYTYTDQPDNVGAMKLGRAALGITPGGDVIDAGLSLLDRLSREGFGVFQIAAGTGQEVGK